MKKKENSKGLAEKGLPCGKGMEGGGGGGGSVGSLT